MRWGQSTPKVLAICETWLSPPWAANKNKAIIEARPTRESLRFHQEQRIEYDRFGEGDGEDRLHQHLRRRARVAADRARGGHADHSHADGGSQGGQADVDISSEQVSDRLRSGSG